jgi:hypothetical protein
MHTLVDFLTHVKGVEYVISVLAIAGFILYLEVLKPRPFRTLAENVRGDVAFLREMGFKAALRSVGRFVAAPFIGLLYVLSLPFLFAFTFAREVSGLASAGLEKVFGLAGRSASFGWRPTEAYLGGKKDRKEKKEKAEEPGAKDDREDA